MKIDFCVERNFEIWFYTPSHNQLLVRSNIDQDNLIDSRIEILFKGVSAVVMPSVFCASKLTIELKPYILELYHLLDISEGATVYTFAKEKNVGFVIAQSYKIDDRIAEFYEPSYILRDIGVVKSISLE